jgi:type I restriction enzyme, R subunit
MEHAIRHEIHVKLEENPAFYTSLKQRLEQLVEDRRQKRIDAAKQLELLHRMVDEVRNEGKAADNAGMNPFAFAIYGLLDPLPPQSVAEPQAQYDAGHKELAGLLQEAIEQSTGIIDWTQKEDVQREMRQRIKKQLRAARLAEDRIEHLTPQIVNLARVRKGR